MVLDNENIFKCRRKKIKDNSTILDLVSEIQSILQKMFVIEINEQVIYKENYETTELNDNDKVKVVVFAGGG